MVANYAAQARLRRLRGRSPRLCHQFDNLTSLSFRAEYDHHGLKSKVLDFEFA
jgi:hypothetical protein